jgi:formate dehydrogenase iron-sulfur subunit
MSKGVLYDGTRCIGCRACSVACKVWNNLRADLGAKGTVEGGIQGQAVVSDKTFTFMRFREVEAEDGSLKWAFAKIQCMHCQHPACQTACIVGALRRSDETGAVTYNRGKCIGCRYCMVACPFGIPCYEWDRPSPWIKKCTFCADRQEGSDREPACVTTCLTDALVFGEREDLIAEARRRFEAEPDRYWRNEDGEHHIYGEHEVGGTAWMYISSVSPADLDLPDVTDEEVPENAHKAMGTLPYYAVGVVGLMGAVYWVTKRKQKIAAGAHDKKEG